MTLGKSYLAKDFLCLFYHPSSGRVSALWTKYYYSALVSSVESSYLDYIEYITENHVYR